MNEARSDLSRRTLPFFALWGVPLATMFLLNFIHPTRATATLILGGSLAWMGFGCGFNALRCGRLHCYLASPVLLLGAALTFLVGFAVLDLGPDGLIYATWGTMGLVALTFVPELIVGKYGGSRDSQL